MATHNVYYVNMNTKPVYVHSVNHVDVKKVLGMTSRYMHTLSTLHGSSSFSSCSCCCR